MSRFRVAPILSVHGPVAALPSLISLFALLALLLLGTPPAHALDLGLPGGGSSCDPTKMSCVPGGGGGSGGGICALFPDKPECK
ncbi:MAG TPA: hypothetical protein VK195_14295, partial [Burkholderiaceae bacterium]|nr:hypothetical protein [Burkholderiaceae bacterium]